jgi:peptidoglycan-associated lipoprotein
MNTNRTLRATAAMLALMSAIYVSGCGSKKADEESTPTAPAMDENVLGDSDSGRAMGLQTVNFPYDSFVLDKTAKSVLQNNAQIMKDKTSLKVQIEGHCDQRGGIQYNIALGEKRANATRAYLVDLGIEGERVTTISYGKERPLATGTSEEDYARNRRANFVITSR